MTMCAKKIPVLSGQKQILQIYIWDFGAKMKTLVTPGLGQQGNWIFATFLEPHYVVLGLHTMFQRDVLFISSPVYHSPKLLSPPVTV